MREDCREQVDAIATDNTRARRDDPERGQANLGRIPARRVLNAKGMGI